METLLIVSLTVVGICILIILIAYLTKGLRTNSFVKEMTEEESLVIEKVKEIFNDNSILDYLEILEKLGISKDVVYSKDAQLISCYLPFKDDNYAKSLFNNYMLAISERYDLQNRELKPIKEDTLGINLNPNESLYHIIHNTTFHEEKVVRRNYTYAGIRFSDGLARGGSLSLMSNEVKNFVPIDIGKILLTNKRILFIGKQNNVTKSIKISDILTYKLYQDGILISQANKKAIILKFEKYNDDEVLLQDGINHFIIVLNRIINNNYDNDSVSIEHSEVQKEREEINHFDKLIKEIAYYVVNKGNATTLEIQREFEIGISRIVKIKKQLDCLGIIKFDSSCDKYTVLVKVSELEERLEKTKNAP